MKKPEKSGAAEFSFNRTSSAKIKYIGKKAYVFNLFMLLTVAIVLTTAFIMFSQKYAPLDEKKPAAQLELFKAYAEGEKAQFYLDNAAKYASEDAVYTFADNGGYASHECNAYNGYTLWADRGRECYPAEDDLAKNYADFFSQRMGKYTENYKSDVVDLQMPNSYDAKFDASSKDVILKATTDLKIAPKPEKEEAPEALPFSGNIAWPAGNKNIVASCYGKRNDKHGFHPGLDIVGTLNSPLYSIADGEVVYAAPLTTLGNYIVVKHDGFSSSYAHLSKILVRKGEKVKAGQKIALSGNTGESSGDHLHFEVSASTMSSGDDYDDADFKQNRFNPLCIYQTNKGSIIVLKKSNCGGQEAEFKHDCGKAQALTKANVVETKISADDSILLIDITKAVEAGGKEEDSAKKFAEEFQKKLSYSGINVVVLNETYKEPTQEELDKYEELAGSTGFIGASMYLEIRAADKKPSLAYSSKYADKSSVSNNLAIATRLFDSLKKSLAIDKPKATAKELDARVLENGYAVYPVMFLDIGSAPDQQKLADALAVPILNELQKGGVKLAIKPSGAPDYPQWRATHYYVASEADFPAWSTTGAEIGSKAACRMPLANRGFYEDVRCEGSGVGSDGKSVYKYYAISPVKASSKPVSADGKIFGARGAVVAHQSIAVPPELMPGGKGTKTYYLYFGECETCKEWNGCYAAQDTGSMITGRHIDLYTGIGKENLNKAAGLPSTVDIWDVECEPGTGSSGWLLQADASAPVNAGEGIDVTGAYEYTLKPATRQNIDYDFNQYVDFAEIAEAANEYMIVCLGKEPTYEDISKCADQFSLMGSPEKIVVEEKERVEGGGGFFVGFTAETPFNYKYHDENPKARFGIVIKDTYPPLMENPSATKTADDKFEIAFKGKSVDIQTYKITYAVKGGSSYMLAEFDSEYKKTTQSPAAQAALEDALLNNEEVCFTMTAIDETDENKATTDIPCQKYGFDSSKISSVTVDYKGG